MVPRTYSSCGDRTFAAAGPHLWNSLPVQLRNPDISYGLLDDSWRDIFLVNHERGALWLLDMWLLRKTLTYLLTYYLVQISCHFGDRKALMFLSVTLSKQRYNKCPDLWPQIACVGCEYGDRDGTCRSISSRNRAQCYHRSHSCCATCRALRITSISQYSVLLLSRSYYHPLTPHELWPLTHYHDPWPIKILTSIALNINFQRWFYTRECGVLMRSVAFVCVCLSGLLAL